MVVRIAFLHKLWLAISLVALSACSPQMLTTDIHDPYETTNRRTHAFNKAIDKTLVRPVAIGYSRVMNDSIETIISNMADNLSVPSHIVNDLLQGELLSAVQNTAKFGLNSTLGLAGIATPAAEFGLDGGRSDFGQTLHVWGVGEGAFIELPLLGPSTGRDAVGTAVDYVLNPVGRLATAQQQAIVTTTRVGSILSQRGQFAGTVDSVLYDSADSYAQMRSIFLQRRRFELGGQQEDVYFDPYDDIFGDE